MLTMELGNFEIIVKKGLIGCVCVLSTRDTNTIKVDRNTTRLTNRVKNLNTSTTLLLYGLYDTT